MRYSTDLNITVPEVIDNESLGLQDLRPLSTEQARVVLDSLIAPKIAELKQWLVELDQLTASYEAEAATYVGMVAQAKERYGQIKRTIGQIDRGISHRGKAEGIEGDDIERLSGLVTKPGRQPALTMLAMREREAAYLRAYLKRWPNAEATNPYKYARPVPRIHEGVEIQPGHALELNERQARAFVNIFLPVSESPVIVSYRAIFDVMERHAFTEAIEKLDAAIAGRRKAA